MSVAEFPLALVIKAVDKATGPLRAMAARMKAITAPTDKLGKEWGDFSKAAGLGNLVEGFKGVGSAIGNVGHQAFALGTQLFAVAGVAGFAMFSIIHGAVEAGDKLAEMADRTGTSVDFYASLGQAANLADVDQEQFNNSMDKFNKALGDAKAGGGPLLELLSKVGPGLAKQLKAVKSTEEGLSLMTDAFARLPDTQRRAALSGAAFGRGNLQMGEFLHQGGAAVQKQQREFLRLAGSQEAFARGASDLDNAIKASQVAFLGLRSAAAGALFPAFTKLTNVVTEFVAKNRDGIKAWAEGAALAINQWVDGGGIDRLVTGFKDIAAVVGRAIDWVGGFKGVALIVGGIMAGPLLVSVLGLIPAFISLAVAIAPLALALFPFIVAAAPWLAAAALIAGAAYLIVKNWETVKTFFAALFPNLSRDIGDATTGIMAFVDWVGKATAAWSAFKGTSENKGSGANWIDNTDAGKWLNNKFGAAATTGADAARATSNADAPRPSAGAGTGQPARVSVDFSNLPKGANVSHDPGDTYLDLAMGRSLVGY